MVPVKAETKDAYKLFHKGALALARAEQIGLRIDVQYCKEQKSKITDEIKHIEKKLQETSLIKVWKRHLREKFNLNSNHQLSKILYDVLAIKPVKSTNKGRGSTDDSSLSKLDVPGLKDILRIRKLSKVRDTYLDGFLREQVNGIIHPSFGLGNVISFRSSCSAPNFQNIPVRDQEAMQICRGAIYPRKGHKMLEVDYKGIEVSVATCYHKDPEMIKYNGDPSSDMHRDQAKEIFLLNSFDKSISSHKLLRYAAKNGFVFPQFYGDYYKNCAKNIAETVKLPTDSSKWEAKDGITLENNISLSSHLISKEIRSFDDFIDHIQKIEDNFWNTRFKMYAEWKNQWWAQYQKKGYLDMLTGFRCSGLMEKKAVINYPIQGSAFHCLLWSFIEVDRISIQEKWKSRIVGQIHDCILVDTHPDELNHVIKTIKQVTCESLPKAWAWIIVPLDVEIETCEIDESWANKEPYDLVA